MFQLQPSKLSRRVGIATLLTCVIPATAYAVTQTIQLSAQPTPQPKIVRGFLRGTVGLHNVVGERDHRQKRCMGYGSVSPDHQLKVTSQLPEVSLQVRSRAKDTTLIVRGPNDRVFCADDSPLGKDAGLTFNNLQPGLYQVWVGAFDRGDRFSYTLAIQTK